MCNLEIGPWQKAKLSLAKEEYQIEIAKNTSFSNSAGTLLSLLAGSSILAPFLKEIELGHGLIISWGIIFSSLAVMYFIYTENTQNRVTTENYIYDNSEINDISEWATFLIETYDDAVIAMQDRRQGQRKLIGVTAAIVVIVNFCISVFL